MRFVDRGVPSIEEDVMEVKVIGVDPHKRSHTAVVLDDDEEIAAQLRVAADRRQVGRLVSWAEDWPKRIWAVENVNGLGRLLSQQLVMAGEQVVDVPASLSHRTRKLSGKSARKTDEHDARSVAIAAAHPNRLRTVELEDFSEVLGLILDRRRHLVDFRHRSICRLHALLAEMVPGGAPTKLTAANAAKVLRSVRPVTPVEIERREIAKQLLDDWRWCDRRIPATEARLHEALQAHGTTLTGIFGIGDIGAATILTIVGDVGRFRSAGNFAAYNGTAPIEASSGDRKRHRLNRGGNRQLNAAIHIAAVTQVRHNGPGKRYLERKLAEHKTNGEAMRALKRQLSDVIYRRLLADQRRREVARGRQTGTRLASA
ncbi:MAG: IS110 family transposase [Acidimicrobiales bacterium]